MSQNFYEEPYRKKTMHKKTYVLGTITNVLFLPITLIFDEAVYFPPNTKLVMWTDMWRGKGVWIFDPTSSLSPLSICSKRSMQQTSFATFLEGM